MRNILTEKERNLSAQIQNTLSGSTFDEALHALAHAEGSIKSVLNDVSISLTFHPTNAENL